MKNSKPIQRLSILCWLGLLGLAFITSCQPQSRGFVLPEGDVEAGKQLFMRLHCNDCHSIGDIKWVGSKEIRTPHVELGGRVTSLKSYGELVTSVINPSHKVARNYQDEPDAMLPGGRSKMELYQYNEVMTVEQLIDIVAFLQSEYKMVMPDNPYPYPGF